MKKILFVVFAASLIWGCSDNSQANIKTVNLYVDAVQQLDYKAALDQLSSDYIGYGPSVNDSIAKNQVEASLKYNIENIYESIEYKKSRSIAVHINDGENKGEWVSHWARLLINYQDGNSAEIMANTIYQLEGGEIVKSFTFYNEADVLEQLGYVFVHPQDF